MTQLAMRILAPLLVMIGGTSFVIQQAVNADLRRTLDSSAWAGFVSYAGGALCMLALAFGLRSPLPSLSAWSSVHWFAWTGGLFGAIYIAISILLVRSMGAAAFVALIVTGQMISALLVDHYGLFGMPQSGLDVQRLIGAALLIGGVVLVRS
jgi:bacterial/archaeal transporter family-2 protein